jgi:hypothetical protein
MSQAGCSHGFRPGRSAHDALERVKEQLRAGRCAVDDTDLEGDDLGRKAEKPEFWLQL